MNVHIYEVPSSALHHAAVLVEQVHMNYVCVRVYNRREGEYPTTVYRHISSLYGGQRPLRVQWFHHLCTAGLVDMILHTG